MANGKTKSTYQDPWHLYILVCADGSFYTGIAKDVQRRLEQHASGRGAKYTQARGAVSVAYSESYPNHHGAAIREAAVKKLTHAQKKILTQTYVPQST